MERHEKQRTTKVKVQDKRHSAGTPAGEETPAGDSGPEEETGAIQHDYLEDLRRVQAEFENYKKRVMRDQAGLTERAGARVIEQLLPVLDNLDRALEHAPDDAGLRIVHKDLLGVLAAEGLEEIPSLGQTFDPRVHEAVESVEDPDVQVAICRTVYRKGYRLKERVLRPAMVVVARPADAEGSGDEEDEAAAEA